MTGLPRGADTALAPVRTALADDAAARAAAITEAAGRDAAELLDAARRDAAEAVAAARTEGTAAGRARAALDSARARRQAGALVLGEQERLRADLEAELLKRAADLRADPRYPRLLDALRGQAAALLGPDAEMFEADAGGIIARTGSRTLDLSLPALARQELADDALAVTALWAA